MAPMQDFVGRIQWPVEVSLGKGLERAITNETSIGYVAGKEGKLIYRGYDAEELAVYSSFEETAFLLVYGHLPNPEELKEFKARLVRERPIPQKVIDVMRLLPAGTHPMAYLRTGLSALGNFDPAADEILHLNAERIGIKLISQLSTLTAVTGRLAKGLEPIPPTTHLEHTADFMYMLTGKEADDVTVRVMDVALILHADHGMNASTFTSMVIASTLSDMYSAMVGGICSLKGPLHGGANERSLDNLLKLKDAEDAKRWVRECIEKKEKIMGFGHRVYKAYDPRARVFKKYAEDICRRTGREKLLEIAAVVEQSVIEAYGEKGIFPNVDFYSGLVYYSLGIDPSMFTPIFAMSRIAGWVARVLEYLPDNRIFRPRAVYIGPMDLKYVPISERQSPSR